MLSPDPYVVNAGYGQDYNRYTYARNNPLCYVDPDGEWVWLIPVAIGAIAGGYTGYKIGKANGATGWGMFGYIAGGAAIGGAAGYAGFPRWAGCALALSVICNRALNMEQFLAACGRVCEKVNVL